MPVREVIEAFGNRLRLRVCGICLSDDKLLLINHKGVGPQDAFWSPPGGGVAFGETAPTALRREFLEETGLTVDVGEFMFVNEFIGPPLHAVELFFRVEITGGQLVRGTDPETAQQVIDQVAFLSFAQINAYETGCTHNLFRHCRNVTELLQLRGYYSFRG